MNITLGNTVVWGAVPSATEYRAELLAQGGETLAGYVVFEPAIAASVLLAGLPAGTYRVRVRAEADGLFGPWSELLTLEFTLYDAPTGLTVV